MHYANTSINRSASRPIPRTHAQQKTARQGIEKANKKAIMRSPHGGLLRSEIDETDEL